MRRANSLISLAVLDPCEAIVNLCGITLELKGELIDLVNAVKMFS